MSYTPPSPVGFDFTASDYSAPAGNAVNLLISEPAGFTGAATQGLVNFIGLTPLSLTGFEAVASQGLITVNGLTPSAYYGKFISQPGQGTVNFAGLNSAGLQAGFSATATGLLIDLAGLLPYASFTKTFSGQALQKELSVSGLMPVSEQFGFVSGATALQVTVTGLTPLSYFGHFVSQPAQELVEFNGLTPAVAAGFSGFPAQAYLSWSSDVSVLVTRNINAPDAGWSAVRYRCYLTPQDSTVFDIEIPITSFQSRLKLNGLSYLSVVLKGADRYVDEIIEGSNRKICIFREYHYIDGAVNSTVIAAANYETLQIAEGGNSGVTATLAGNGEFAPSDTATIELRDPTYRSYASGHHRYRCAIDARLRPGDTAQINGDSFTVNEIVYVIDTKTAIMEIAS